MKPHLKGVEIETPGRGDHDLAVDHAAVGQAGEEHLVQLGKVPVEGPQVAALDEDVPAAAEDDGAEPVPFRLVEEAVAHRKFGRELRQHRLDGRRDGKLTHLGRDPQIARAFHFSNAFVKSLSRSAIDSAETSFRLAARLERNAVGVGTRGETHPSTRPSSAMVSSDTAWSSAAW